MKIVEELKIDFTDFWPGFIKTDNFFYKLLGEKYKLVISDQPDILFYSVYGNKHVNYRCTKVLFTGEAQRPDFVLCDFAFSFDYPVSKRNYRLPLYALYGDVTALVKRKVNARERLKEKTKFCCFIVSNGDCDVRNDFFIELSKYKRVDSGGKIFNNIGHLVGNKLEFIKDYKFVIAFENRIYPGYTSEKIFEPLTQNCIPLYWGNPLVYNDFSTDCFINCHDFKTFDEVISRIKEIDNDDELYMKYLSAPAFNDDQLNEYVKKENIIRRLDEIVAHHFNGKWKLLPLIRPYYFKALMKSRSFTKHFSSLRKMAGSKIRTTGHK
jgi:hypothetical protein